MGRGTLRSLGEAGWRGRRSRQKSGALTLSAVITAPSVAVLRTAPPPHAWGGDEHPDFQTVQTVQTVFFDECNASEIGLWLVSRLPEPMPVSPIL